MSWFKKKPLQTDKKILETESRVEIVAHKKATKKQVNEVKKANENLNKLFEDNNFTLKLFLASKKH